MCKYNGKYLFLVILLWVGTLQFYYSFFYHHPQQTPIDVLPSPIALYPQQEPIEIPKQEIIIPTPSQSQVLVSPRSPTTSIPPQPIITSTTPSPAIQVDVGKPIQSLPNHKYTYSGQYDKAELEEILSFTKNNSKPVIPEHKLDLKPYTLSNRHAIVTMIGTTGYKAFGTSRRYSYWKSALALIQGLREVKTRVPNILVLSGHLELLAKEVQDCFERLGAKFVILEDIKLGENMKVAGHWSKYLHQYL